MIAMETVSVYESFLSKFHSDIQILLTADIQENSVLFESTQKLRKYLTTGELCFQKLFMDFSLTASKYRRRIRRTNIIRTGLVPVFVKILRMKTQLRFQCEAAWALTAITAGTTEDTQLVIDSGAVPLLVEMLKLNGPEYVEAATRALGNIMGDSPSAKDVVLAHGVVPTFCEILSNYDEITYLPLLKTVAWAVFNIYRKIPHPPLDVAEMIIKPVVKALKSRDLEIVKDCCCTLSRTIAAGGFD
jgi:hypothetical protein